MKKRRSAFRNRLEYGFLRGLELFFRILPFRGAYFLGRRLGELAYLLDGRHRRVAISNLAAAFPEKSSREIRRLARSTFRHFGTVLVDVLKLPPRLLAGDDTLVDVDHPELLAEAASLGKPVIATSGHIGNWELGPWVIGRHGIPPFSIARPLDNPFLEERLRLRREALGQKVIYKEGALREMARRVKEGKHLALLIDQNAGRQGIFVDFFGRPASTVDTVAALALKYGCGILFCCVVRDPRDRQYRFYAEPVWFPEPTGDDEKDRREITQKITSQLETYIRKYPEQWLWLHRRWKTQPS